MLHTASNSANLNRLILRLSPYCPFLNTKLELLRYKCLHLYNVLKLQKNKSCAVQFRFYSGEEVLKVTVCFHNTLNSSWKVQGNLIPHDMTPLKLKLGGHVFLV